MKKVLFPILGLILAVGLVLPAAAVATGAQARGPWEVKMEGNGTVSGGTLPNYGVVETDIGWNFKMNANREVQGHLNIVEKLSDGTTRHFQLSGDEVLSVSDPTVRPILFNCATYEVRVEGTNDKGQRVAAHFRDSANTQYPNTVWYFVTSGPQHPTGVITDTGAQLTLSNPFTMECNAQ